MTHKQYTFVKSARLVSITLLFVFILLFVLALINHEKLNAMNYIGAGWAVVYGSYVFFNKPVPPASS